MELRRFLGMINYYQDMVPQKTTLYKPLYRFKNTKVPFTCPSSDTKDFRGIKRALAEAVLLAFPDFKEHIHVYTDASGTQLGGLRMQGNKILACYSRILTNYIIITTQRSLSFYPSLGYSANNERGSSAFHTDERKINLFKYNKPSS